jgi:UDP-N-acetylmuramate dehydrogenase
MTDDPVLKALRIAGAKRATRFAPMSRHTSWRIGGPADYCCVVEEDAQLLGAVRVACDHDLPWIVLGGGNNVLVSDEGIAGLVILNRLRGISIESGPDPGKPGEPPRVHCGAGVFFAKVAQFTAQRGFAGMEWGIAIPGTVGGGVVNNAGAHWSDVSRSLISARVLNSRGHQEELRQEALAYRYRQSVLKTSHTTQTQLVVTRGSFRLCPDDPRATLARVEELRQHRLRTQPVKEASAGSTFKNPEGGHAGALIDRAGLKGHRIGGAQIASLHANFILNVGGSRASDVLALIRMSRERVLEQTGILLQTEVQFVGRWREEELSDIIGESK